MSVHSSQGEFPYQGDKDPPIGVVNKNASSGAGSFVSAPIIRPPQALLFFWDVQVWPYAAHQMETADWHTAHSGSGGSTIVLLGVFVHDWDEPAADPRTLNRREVHSSPIHDGVACCCRRDSSFWATPSNQWVSPEEAATTFSQVRQARWNAAELWNVSHALVWSSSRFSQHSSGLIKEGWQTPAYDARLSRGAVVSFLRRASIYKRGH
jgi:hypothetical protein